MFPLTTSCASFNLIITSPSANNPPPPCIPAYLAQQMTPLSQGHAAHGGQRFVVLCCEQHERQWEKQTKELPRMGLPADPHHSKSQLTTGDNGNVFLAIIAGITTSGASGGAEQQQASEAALWKHPQPSPTATGTIKTSSQAPCCLEEAAAYGEDEMWAVYASIPSHFCDAIFRKGKKLILEDNSSHPLMTAWSRGGA